MQFYDKRLTLLIDKETLQELKRIAKKQKMPISVFVRMIIYKELKRYRKNLKEYQNEC